MSKKVTLNGIELALPKYDDSATTLFDYLENVVSHLEKGLSDNDDNFQLSINVDFSASKSPKHTFHSNGSTGKKTRDKVARILKKTVADDQNQVAGSVRVNLSVQDD